MVLEAAGDETCRAWVEQWWAEASPHLDQPAEELTAYRFALLERFLPAPGGLPLGEVHDG